MKLRVALAACGLALLAHACDSFGTPADETPSTSEADAGPNVDGAAPTSDASDDRVAATDGGGGDADANADAASGCPIGDGPSMRVVALSNGRKICVDLTQVTGAQYAAFRSSGTDLSALAPKVPAACGSIALSALSPADASGELPRTNVSFCSAAYYCVKQGKRLCGSAADGGAVVSSSNENEPLGEWELACANGKTEGYYPWGTTDRSVSETVGCQTKDVDASAPRPVAVAKQCGPGDGLGPYDMIGNVWEWVNIRRDSDTASSTALRGGSYADPTVGNGCATTHGEGAALGEYGTGSPTTGFRCCADAP